MTIDRKPFQKDAGYLSSLRKGAGRGWVVAYKAGNNYRVECKAHGASQSVKTSAADAKARVRTVGLWCADCERDMPLFDKFFQRGELRFRLRSQKEQWKTAIAEINVPDVHPAFLVHYSALEPFIPAGSGIKLIEPRMITAYRGPEKGERAAKRFQAEVPIANAQAAIAFMEAAIAHLSVIPKSAAAEAAASAE